MSSQKSKDVFKKIGDIISHHAKLSLFEKVVKNFPHIFKDNAKFIVSIGTHHITLSSSMLNENFILSYKDEYGNFKSKIFEKYLIKYIKGEFKDEYIYKSIIDNIELTVIDDNSPFY